MGGGRLSLEAGGSRYISSGAETTARCDEGAQSQEAMEALGCPRGWRAAQAFSPVPAPGSCREVPVLQV